MVKILLTGVGGPTPLGIGKSLIHAYGANISLIGIDADPLAPGLYNKDLFDETYRVPHIASNSEYWDAIHEIVDREKVDFAFVVPETEIIEWAKFKENQDLPCKSLIPDYDVACFMYDKLSVSEALITSELTPPTIEISSFEDARLLEEKMKYPYWVRIRSGAGALGSFKVETLNDIENWFKVNPSKSNFIASPYLPGRNYACKVLFKNGSIVMAASGERVGYLMPEAAPSGVSGMSANGRLINNRELIYRSVKAISTIFESFNKTANGMFTVDFKESTDGIPYITEINIRHVSFTHAFSLAGANFSKETLEVFLFENEFETNYKTFEKEYWFIRGVDSDIIIVDPSQIK